METNKNYCNRCGTKLESGAFFCKNCGEGYSAPISPLLRGYRKQHKLTIERSNILPIVCLVIGIIMILTGFDINIPSEKIYNATEYVGGDAYNYIIKSNFLSNSIAVAQITKCIYISIGLLIACMSALKINYKNSLQKNK